MAAISKAPVTKPRSGLEKWQDGIDKADSRWDVHDCEIQRAVNEFNRHLSGAAGYFPLDWRLIKAMMWVETGANTNLWNTNPIQIGMYNDPGLSDLLAADKGGQLILPPRMRLTVGLVRSNPAQNIRAGIGYLLMRMARFETRSVVDEDTTVREVTVKAGDVGLEKIAIAQGTTVAVLRHLNPTAHVLHPGQRLKYQKASMKKVIVRWMPLTSLTVAVKYNTRDPEYARKLDYALAAVGKRSTTACQP